MIYFHWVISLRQLDIINYCIAGIIELFPQSWCHGLNTDEDFFRHFKNYKARGLLVLS